MEEKDDGDIEILKMINQSEKYCQNSMDETKLNTFRSEIKRRKKIAADMR